MKLTVMKLSVLISRLAAAIEKHGDLEVVGQVDGHEETVGGHKASWIGHPLYQSIHVKEGRDGKFAILGTDTRFTHHIGVGVGSDEKVILGVDLPG